MSSIPTSRRSKWKSQKTPTTKQHGLKDPNSDNYIKGVFHIGPFILSTFHLIVKGSTDTAHCGKHHKSAPEPTLVIPWQQLSKATTSKFHLTASKMDQRSDLLPSLCSSHMATGPNYIAYPLRLCSACATLRILQFRDHHSNVLTNAAFQLTHISDYTP